MNPYPRTWIDIDLPALAHNLGIVRRTIPASCKLGLVAKADAYGHGLVPVSRFAAQGYADWICVATVQEGLTLRDAGIGLPILVLSPILPVEAEQAVFYDLRVCVERAETAEALQTAAIRQQKQALVHLEVDTGLSRFGCMPDEVEGIVARIRSMPQVSLEGVCQHFVDSGHNAQRTQEQSTAFEQLVANLSPLPMVHGCNSAGAFRTPSLQGDLVRIGILAYGIDPYGLSEGQARPLLKWKARVTAMRKVRAGATVSYSETFVCRRDTVIATLGVGYGDGYPRALSSKGVVRFASGEAPVIGLVCMDQMLVDVTDLGPVELGDEATLIGDGVTVERLAHLAGTNCHEITTRIMSRVPRRYVWG